MFTLNATSKGIGKLIISDFKVDGVSQTDMVENTETRKWYDLGRLALITSSTYRMPFQIKLMNVGSSPVTVLSAFDGQIPGAGPQQVSATTTTLLSQIRANGCGLGVGGATFYEEMVTGCSAAPLQPNEFCTVQGIFHLFRK